MDKQIDPKLEALIRTAIDREQDLSYLTDEVNEARTKLAKARDEATRYAHDHGINLAEYFKLVSYIEEMKIESQRPT